MALMWIQIMHSKYAINSDQEHINMVLCFCLDLGDHCTQILTLCLRLCLSLPHLEHLSSRAHPMEDGISQLALDITAFRRGPYVTGLTTEVLLALGWN